VAVRLWAPLVKRVACEDSCPCISWRWRCRAAWPPSIDLDRGIGFGAAGERQGIVIGDAVRTATLAVGGERIDAWITGATVSIRHAERRRRRAVYCRATSVAVSGYKLWAPLRERRGGEATRPLLRCGGAAPAT
jgi:hypothetical protein